MHWYVRQRSENGRRGDYRHWVWVLNQGPLVSTTIVFRLEHMLAARMSPTVTSSTLKVPSPERRMTPHFCNQSRLPSTTSYRRLTGHDNPLKPRPGMSMPSESVDEFGIASVVLAESSGDFGEPLADVVRALR